MSAQLARGAEPAAPAATEPAENHFDIWEIRVEGNSLLDVRDVERAVYPSLGPGRSLADVETARSSLEKLYQSRGYATVIVNIPEQAVEQGLVTLKITEARLDRVHVTGARYHSNREIRESITEAAPGEVPNVTALIGQIGKVSQRSRDVQVAPILKAGRVPGTVDLELRVKDARPIHADVSLTNAHTLDTTDLRLNAGLTYSNLWQKDHSLSVQYQMSPQNVGEVDVWASTYLWRRADSDSLFAFFWVDSNSDVVSLGTTTVLGKGTTLGARSIHPDLLSFGSWRGTFVYGADYKDTTDNLELGPDLSLETKLQYMNLTTAVTFARAGESAQTSFDVGLNFGPRGLLNDRTEFESKRFKAEPNYLYMTAAARHERRFAEDWSWLVRGRSQMTGSRLIPNEQFSMGGTATVRGYLEAERLADYGFVATLELRRAIRQQPVYGLSIGDAYAFVDGGYGWINDALPDQDDRFGLLSVGIGMDLLLLDNFDLTLQGALPLNAAQETRAGDLRLLFEAQYNL
jgi:hemolysin activation/secretion protein